MWSDTAQGDLGMLELVNLSKEFGRLVAVNSINLSLEKGEIRGLIGPNGSGKSSLFDAFKMWHHLHDGGSGSHDADYHLKKGEAVLPWGQHIDI